MTGMLPPHADDIFVKNKHRGGVIFNQAGSTQRKSLGRCFEGGGDSVDSDPK